MPALCSRLGLALSLCLLATGSATGQIGTPLTFSGVSATNNVVMANFLDLAMSDTMPNFGLFTGRTSARIGIDTVNGGSTAILRTGDPIPAGTGVFGTFNEFSNPSVNRATGTPTSSVAFYATLNSANEDAGLFLLDATGITAQCRRDQPADVARPERLHVNDGLGPVLSYTDVSTATVNFGVVASGAAAPVGAGRRVTDRHDLGADTTSTFQILRPRIAVDSASRVLFSAPFGVGSFAGVTCTLTTE